MALYDSQGNFTGGQKGGLYSNGQYQGAPLTVQDAVKPQADSPLMTFGKGVANIGIGALKSGAQALQDISTIGQTIAQKVGIQKEPIAKLPSSITEPSGVAQKIGYYGGEAAQIVAPFVGGLKLLKGTKLAEALKTPEVEKAWNMIKPELTAKEQAEAVKAGKIVSKGPFKTITQVPKGRDLEMIEAAQPYVANAKNEIDAVSNMKNGIKESANKVREGLKQSGAIWNKNELVGQLNKIEKPITVKSDATLDKIFDNFKKAVLKLADGSSKKTEGILDMRQNLDKLIEDEFGSAIYDKTNPMSNVIRKFRSTLNDFAESKIPDGKLPDGSSFKGELRKQSLLYDAIDNTAPKVGKVGSTGVSRFMKEYPKTTKVIKTGAIMGTGALGAETVGRRLMGQ